MRSISLEHKINYILRASIAMCFIGHGAFGIITKEIWCNYFGVFGIGKVLAYQLMPIVGIFDISMGLIMIFYPIRAIALWLVIWGVITALLRPFSGEPVAEFIERAGNYGIPLAYLIVSGGNLKKLGTWFEKQSNEIILNEHTTFYLIQTLKIVIFLLLFGHGWLNLIHKQGLINQYVSLGFQNPINIAQILGIIEVSAAIIILIKPFRNFVFFFFVWKIVSELFYPHWELFEWIERGGSYGALLALWYILPSLSIKKNLQLSHS